MELLSAEIRVCLKNKPWICGVRKGYLCRSCIDDEPKVDIISLLTNYTHSENLTNSGWSTTDDTTKDMLLRID